MKKQLTEEKSEPLSVSLIILFVFYSIVHDTYSSLFYFLDNNNNNNDNDGDEKPQIIRRSKKNYKKRCSNAIRYRSNSVNKQPHVHT